MKRELQNKEDQLDSEKNQEDVNRLFEKSSKKNRNSLILFVASIVSILFVVYQTTDFMLLAPDSFINFPVIKYLFSLDLFYSMTPMLLFFFHSSLLSNLREHRNKLLQWIQLNPDKERTLIDQLIYNVANRPKNKNLIATPSGFLLWLVVCLLPISTLACIQFRFSDYHDIGKIEQNFVFIIFDFLLVLMWLTNESRNRLETTNENSIRTPIKSWKSLQKVIKEKIDSIGFLFVSPIQLFPLLIVVFFSAFNLYILHNIDDFEFNIAGDSWNSINQTLNAHLIPTIDLQGQTLVASFPDETTIQDYINLGKTREDALKKYSKGLELHGRDLRRANFSRSKLFNANLNRCQLQGASFDRTQLQGASFSEAQLQGVSFDRTQLQSAYFSDAQLQGASFDRTQLQYATFSEAQLQGASFDKTQLQGASFRKAQLQGASFDKTQLQGASFYEAQLQGASFTNAQLQGASLWVAQFQGASFNRTQLQGASFYEAQLQGASFNRTQLQGASFNKTQLQGTSLSNTQTGGNIGSSSWKRKTDWNRIVKIAPMIPDEKSRKRFLEQIKMAQQRTQNFPLTIDNDIERFDKIRTELLCEYQSIPLYRLGKEYLITLLEQNHKSVRQGKTSPICENILVKAKKDSDYAKYFQ